MLGLALVIILAILMLDRFVKLSEMLGNGVVHDFLHLMKPLYYNGGRVSNKILRVNIILATRLCTR